MSATKPSLSKQDATAPQPHRPFLYHIYTIYLFTANDLQSIVIPETLFGIFSALSGPQLTTNTHPSFRTIVSRLPHTILWNYLNCLLFDVANQRLPSSILEDSVNKSWRPLPSHRLSPTAARRLLLGLLPLVYIASLYLGGVSESVAMMALTWMYNDLGGADENYIVRNAINAFGFICYSSGSTSVAAGGGAQALHGRTHVWLAIVGAIVFSTLQMQDMADMEGDLARGRRTLPLVHGEWVARWSIALPVAVWSVVCPTFWELGWSGYALAGGTGAVLVGRLFLLRSVQGDKGTWKVWCAWTSVLYALPLMKEYEYLTGK